MRMTVTRECQLLLILSPTVTKACRLLWILATDCHVGVTAALVELGLTRKSAPALSTHARWETSYETTVTRECQLLVTLSPTVTKMCQHLWILATECHAGVTPALV
ncbi:hypothetical protein AVEN_71091-1 [Araneus ventricosus]|uniref:Uncharacterized protein n=1 Tax=Araneus ventricosus TaxID=182803 RepID=A0A4Y2X966_ARAVE|nr:hypothetical protein AVEN_71091-1 [Araneus ventricosus]